MQQRSAVSTGKPSRGACRTAGATPACRDPGIDRHNDQRRRARYCGPAGRTFLGWRAQVIDPCLGESIKRGGGAGGGRCGAGLDLLGPYLADGGVTIASALERMRAAGEHAKAEAVVALLPEVVIDRDK